MKLDQNLVERWEGLEGIKLPGEYLPRSTRALFHTPGVRATITLPGVATAPFLALDPDEDAPRRIPPVASIDQAAPAAAASGTAKRERARVRFLSAEGQSPTLLEQEVAFGTNDLLEVNFLDRCSLVCRAIGRLEAKKPQGRIRATGFLIGPGLLMTNHHVLSDDAVAATGVVEFGYRYDVAGELPQTTIFDLDPATFYVASEALDYAVVAVSPTSRTGRETINSFGYLRLYPEPGKVRKTEFVTIIQHPEGDPMQIALRENQVTRLVEDEPFIQYEADTAHGSSGAPVFNDSLQLVALHSGGRIKRSPTGEYLLRNGGSASSLDGLRESDVLWEANAGSRVSFICADLLRQVEKQYASHLPVLQQAMAGGDILARAVVAARTGTATPPSPATASPPPPPTESDRMPEADLAQPRAEDRRVPVTVPASPGSGVAIPLVLHVTLADPRAEPTVARPQPEGLEQETSKMQIPVIYDGLEERGGYDPGFLDLMVPIPPLTESGRKVAAPLLDDSGFELRYHKFSIIMHGERRLAILTASNVDYRDARRKINGEKPSRTQLTEIPKGVPEQWVTDPRIHARHQLPDVFFTDDDRAFDKGHLVRRDDVCWGDSFEDMQMANGDTYHVPNCSPQVMVFNQAQYGEFNWGDFELEVQEQTKAEKAVVFSGPVLAPDDRWFRGRDEEGPVRVQIPRRFWKIIVARGEDGLQAFGFVLAQDVREVTEEEFAVSKEWVHATERIANISRLLRGWVDLSALEKIDQYKAA